MATNGDYPSDEETPPQSPTGEVPLDDGIPEARPKGPAPAPKSALKKKSVSFQLPELPEEDPVDVAVAAKTERFASTYKQIQETASCESNERSATQEHLKMAKFIAIEEDIKQKLSIEIDPTTKANMEWELRIICSANMHFFKYGDAYSSYQCSHYHC